MLLLHEFRSPLGETTMKNIVSYRQMKIYFCSGFKTDGDRILIFQKAVKMHFILNYAKEFSIYFATNLQISMIFWYYFFFKCFRRFEINYALLSFCPYLNTVKIHLKVSLTSLCSVTSLWSTRPGRMLREIVANLQTLVAAID